MRRVLLAALMMTMAHSTVALGDSEDPVVSQEAPEDQAVVEDPRVACIEMKESGGANVWNRGGSGAGGVLQYFESTFRSHAEEMGHPDWSRWNPDQARAVAAYDLSVGRRRQWTVSGC